MPPENPAMSICRTPLHLRFVPKPKPNSNPEPVVEPVVAPNCRPAVPRVQNGSASAKTDSKNGHSSHHRHAAPVELLDEKFQMLDRYIGEYVQSKPATAAAAVDADRFVNWLSEHKNVDPEQRDILVCLYSRYAVEAASLQRRLAHARFAELLKKTPENMGRLNAASRLMIQLNPVHVWATFKTPTLLGRGANLPACVLFFQVGREVRTAILNSHVSPLVRGLERGNIRVGALLRKLKPHERDDVIAVLKHLVDLKIIAIA